MDRQTNGAAAAADGASAAPVGSESAITTAVLLHGPLSRSSLTRRLGLSAASLTRLTKPLLDAGVLVEHGDTGTGTIGRPSRPLDVSESVGRFVGIKLTEDTLYGVITTVRADVEQTITRPLSHRDPDSVVALIVDVVDELSHVGRARDSAAMRRGTDNPRAGTLSAPLAVGVTLGGVVHDGTVLRSEFLDWTDVPLAKLVRDALGVDVVVDNDLLAIAEAHRWFGPARHEPGFIVTTIGAGVGYAVVSNGATVRTADATDGIGSHAPLSRSGPVCRDGHRGCATSLLTSGAIAAQVSVAHARLVSYDEALELARNGDRVAARVVAEAADALGLFLALATSFALHSTVVLGGEGVALYDMHSERVAAVIAEHRGTRAAPVVIEVDRSGFDGWARAAAAIAIQYALPRLRQSRRAGAERQSRG